jgi:polyhydroxyalkanoate synthesis regulator phasin
MAGIEKNLKDMKGYGDDITNLYQSFDKLQGQMDLNSDDELKDEIDQLRQELNDLKNAKQNGKFHNTSQSYL